MPADALFAAAPAAAKLRRAGEAALRAGEVAVVTYAAGVGSRWTQGAGVVKGLHPFARFAGRHRNFIEVHLAKTRRAARTFGAEVPHVFTTSYLTHAPIERFLREAAGDALDRTVWLSPGRSIGLRLIPTVRDLRFAWEETAQQKLDEQQEKMRESVRAALTAWARAAGEAADYTDNLPGQCLHPVGHWFEIPNLLKNGVLARLLAGRPALRTLLVHNIDTLGTTSIPACWAGSAAAGATLGWEVIAAAGRGSRRRPRAPRRPPAPRRGPGAAARGGRIRPHLLQHQHLLGRHRPPAGPLRAGPRRPGRRGKNRGGGPRPRRAHADLRHAQGREETLGPRPGGCVPRGAIRKTLGRHDRRCPSAPTVLRSCRGTAASSSRTRPSSTSGSATAPPRSSKPWATGRERAAGVRDQRAADGSRPNGQSAGAASASFRIQPTMPSRLLS